MMPKGPWLVGGLRDQSVHQWPMIIFVTTTTINGSRRINGVAASTALSLRGGWGGLPQNHERAVELFKPGAAQGNPIAQYNLGAAYEGGWGVAQSIAKARRHYELASTHGVTQAHDALQRIALDYPLLGQRVVFVGLTRADLNGTRGTTIDFGDGRYVVKRDKPTGQEVRVKPTNIVKEEDDT